MAVERRDLLVGVLTRKRDLSILLNEGWYRIPVEAYVSKSAWPPRWLAFYESASIRKDYGIYRYAPVRHIEERSREELFPGELAGARAGKRYHKVHLGPMRDRTVRFMRPRRFSFISTSLTRFEGADTVNDLFAGSPLEDRVWAEFKKLGIPAERQWRATVEVRRRDLDFALFCNSGKIDVETDGDTYHITREQAPLDNERNNELTTDLWYILRYGTDKIMNHLSECIEDVYRAERKLNGFESPKLVPDIHRVTKSGIVTQPSMFEERSEYDPDFRRTIDSPSPAKSGEAESLPGG